MNRYARISALVLALLLVVAGSALATRGGKSAEHRSPVAASHQLDASKPDKNDRDPADPEDSSDDGGPSAALLDRLVARLADAGIETDAETLAGLAADYGVGGAVRLVTWAAASGMDVSELAAMFDSGMGWGKIARELASGDPSVSVSPGIGWVMGHGHGHGQSAAEAHRP